MQMFRSNGNEPFSFDAGYEDSLSLEKGYVYRAVQEWDDWNGWMIKPANFDPARKYPLMFHVYGEPWGQTVTDRWGGGQYLWHMMLAQQGYVVACFDNRGTPCPRGRDWRKSVYRQIGTLASHDQSAAARELLKRPWLDADRVGVWGWSGGGRPSSGR